MVLSDGARDEILAVARRYPEGKQKSAVMPALFIAQRELGWLPPEAQREIAELLELAPVHVNAVASFYTMYEQQPVGRHVIDVCTCISCLLCGGYDIVAHLERLLDVEVGQTTADGAFTLREQECIGACANAPALQVDYRFCENLTPEAVEALVARLRAEG